MDQTTVKRYYSAMDKDRACNVFYAVQHPTHGEWELFNPTQGFVYIQERDHVVLPAVVHTVQRGFSMHECSRDGGPLTPHPYSQPDPKVNIWDTQVGGTHYTKMRIQPFQFSMANKLDPMQHTIIKYVARFRDKGGIPDLEKAKQTIDLLIDWEKTNANAS